jgi:benzylsuccinate CoA-transferase BbsF subunit
MTTNVGGKQALAGIRIVDLSWAAAGPLCTMYLASLGAEVVKIETGRSMDLSRRGYYTPVPDPDASPNFNDMNHGKLSFRVDLSTREGQALAGQLIAVSDVLIQNFRVGVIGRLGLGYEAVRRLRPDIVMLSSSSGGQSGPEKDLGGYATNFGAHGGLGYITGHEGGPGTEVWDSVDMRLGTSITLAVLMALYHRRRTGRGQHIDLSSREVVSSNIGDVFLDYFMNGRSPVPRGNQDDIMAPHNCYPCRGDDRWISIAVATDEEWQALCQAAGHPDWAEDGRFIDRYSRWRNQDVLDPLIAEWTRRQKAPQLTTLLQDAGVAATLSMSVADLWDDPHVEHRGLFWQIEHPKLGTTKPMRPPWILSETPARPSRRGPDFGEHTEWLVTELLGLPQDELSTLNDSDVFR